MDQNVDVFISHHTSSCLPVTQAICNHLENSGIRCWYAPRDTEGAYAACIASAIERCRVFVLVLNRQSSASQDVLNEINLAVERIRKGESLAIIPFQISADTISNDAKYYIGRIHWIDAITPPLEERIRELKTRVLAVLQKQESAPVSRQASGTSQRMPSGGALKSTHLLPNGNFVCRQRELTEIGESMTRCNKLFIQGMGGIGKSELAKAYANGNRSRYHTVIFAICQTGLQDLLIYDAGFQIEGMSRTWEPSGRAESDEAYFDRKLQWLKDHTDAGTLFIIDNFDTLEDSRLEAFLSGPYSVILTTRNDFGELGLPVLHLEAMETEEEQLELFRHYYRRPIVAQHQQTLRQMISLVGGHTLAIELIAKFMFHRRVPPDKMLAMLRESGINAMAVGTVSHGFGQARSGYANIRQLFDLDRLTDSERYILQNLALVPLGGIDFTTFGDLCELEDFADIDDLIRRSWIRYNINEDTVSVHPLIRDMVMRECAPGLTACGVYVRNLTAKLMQLWSLPVEQKILYGNLGKTLYEQIPCFDADHLDTYRAVAFGLCLLEQHDLSRKVSEQCLQICCEVYGAQNAQAAEIYYRLADNELYRNNYEEAIVLLTKAIDILEVAAPNSERLAYMIKFLCWTRLGWLTDHEETERLLHRSNAILLAQEPRNLSQIASQNSAYANVYYLMGQYEKALDYAEDAYRVFYELHGELHGDTLAPMSIKAKILSKLGRAEESISLCNRVIDIQLQLTGETSQKILNRYEALAEIHENLGDKFSARQVLEKILLILNQKKDVSSPFFRKISGKLERLRN